MRADRSGLTGIEVLDVTDSIAGQFCTRLLADHGANVTLVEPPGGSPVRTLPPVHRATGESLLFEHLNGGKRSRVLDPAARASAAWTAWCRRADVLVTSDPALASSVAARAGSTVVCLLTDFGTDGPYATWRGGELVHQALSGSMYVTGSAGREPLYGVGERASYAAGLSAYSAVLAALRVATSGRRPPLVEITVHEAAAAMEQNFSTQWAYNRTMPRREDKARPRGRARCRDGWVVYFVRTGQWPAFCEVFGVPELAGDPRFAEWPALCRNFAAAEAELHEAAGRMSVDELVRRAERALLVLAPVRDAQQLLTEPHLLERGFWQQTAQAPALGPMFRFSDITWVHRPAPCLGTPLELDDDEAGSRSVPAPSDDRAGARRSPAVTSYTGARPLEGIRVLELTSAWAGPMAARILASLGADVIKVEGPSRYDAWRGERTDPALSINYPDLEPGDRPYDRHLFFNTQNHDKRSLVVDLKSADGLGVIRRLVSRVDVVLANWSPGTLDRLGLGFDSLRALNPRIIVVEMPAMGGSGPLAGQRGLGPTMEAMAGITALIGYEGGPPLGSGTAYLDPVGALHGAAAAMTALVHRDRTGRGQHVEVPQREAAMHWIGEQLLDAIVNGTPFESRGNARPAFAPHGAYPAAGDDEWVAIAVGTTPSSRRCAPSSAIRRSRSVPSSPPPPSASGTATSSTWRSPRARAPTTSTCSPIASRPRASPRRRSSTGVTSSPTRTCATGTGSRASSTRSPAPTSTPASRPSSTVAGSLRAERRRHWAPTPSTSCTGSATTTPRSRSSAGAASSPSALRSSVRRGRPSISRPASNLRLDGDHASLPSPRWHARTPTRSATS